jgi:membrane-bound lytic murein transglycosylase D
MAMIWTTLPKVYCAHFLVVWFVLFALANGEAVAADDSAKAFPRYRTIERNVTFWEKIYGYYSVNEAVIHDRTDLAKIYRVLPLLDQNQPDASRRNAQLRKEVLQSYQAMLHRLAREIPRTPEEKRIAALFPGPNGRKEMALAAENIRIQTGLRERFLEGVVVSGALMPEIRRILRDHGLPEELAYLPHVESSFNLNAHSRVGAMGIWQFTLATGQQYLTIDDVVDERRDPFLATTAAAKYLQKSYRALNSWPLAITSYNYGLAGTLRALREKGGYEQIFSGYQKGHFKFAARNFYPEFLAAMKVARQLEQNPAVRQLSPTVYRSFTTPGYIDAAALSRHFGVTSQTLREHNPSLRPAVFNGEKMVPKGYVLRLPADRIRPDLVSLFPANLVRNEQLANLYHRVQRGETAGTIAKRYGVSLKSLAQANNLDRRATVILNQQLRIPKAVKAGPVRGPAVSIITAQGKRQVVQSKEVPILSGIKKQRPLKSVAITLPPPNPDNYKVAQVHDKEGRTYGYITVQPEESLALYAGWLGLEVKHLQAINRLPGSPDVYPGQSLLLAFPRHSTTLFEQQRLDHLRKTESLFFSTNTVVGKKTYRVSHGDTLWDLCSNKFAIPVWLLERYNASIDLRRLITEQELIIPVIQPI